MKKVKIPSDMVKGSLFYTAKFDVIEIVEYKTHKEVMVKVLPNGRVIKGTSNEIRKNRFSPSTSEKLSVGMEFKTTKCGEVVIKGFPSKVRIDIEFKDTGTRRSVRIDSLIAGTVLDPMCRLTQGVGYLGIGKYSYSENKMAHKCWSRMLERCYSKSWHAGKPTYSDCEVCPEWHNFQNFAEWYQNNYPKDGKKYQLDKDIKTPGNKTYSPETCLFVTASENTIHAHAKRYIFSSPSGETVEIYNMSKFCSENNLNKSKMAAVNTGKMAAYKGWTKLT